MEEEPKVGLEERELAGAIPPGATVQVMRGFFEGLSLPIDRDWVVVGRGRGADVVIAEPTISRAHAAIGFDGEAFFIEDLGSTNGTSVNGKREDGAVDGKRAPRLALNSGDEIRLGKLLLQVTLPADNRASGL
jgi:pSer/pThr/pTyr-binding forkhead associated (FHA) protein